jgi:hypothetical protein
MRQLRTLAVAAASTILIMGQAIAAFACEQHQDEVSMTDPARSATAKYYSLTVAKKAGFSILADSVGITASPSRRWVRWESTTSRAIW